MSGRNSEVCENKWLRRIVRVKRVDRRRMYEPREDIGVQMSLAGRLVKCRLKWAGRRKREWQSGPF